MADVLLIVFGFLVVIVSFSFSIIKTKRQTGILKMQGRALKNHMRELEQRNLELQKLNQEKLQIISLVSHDLKGPFNRIFALIQLMSLGQENLTDEQKEYLNKIHQISADGLGMIRNLLDNRKFEDKGIELNLESINLSALVATLVKSYQTIAEKKKIDIELENVNLVMIKADRLYLSRVIENLLSNAIKFSPNRKKIFIKLTKSPEAIIFSIKDQGPGISREDQNKMYQRFQQLTARPTGGESSTGLGLFIVKKILDKIEGEIVCESSVGQGTCFTIRFPKIVS